MDCRPKTVLLAEREALERRLAELEGVQARCRRAEAALDALEERNRLLGDCAPLGIFTVDREGQVTGFNRKMREMLSLPPDEEASLLQISEIPVLREAGLAEEVYRCMETREPLVFEHCLPEASVEGCEMLRYHLSPLSDAEGRVFGVIAFVEDITELKRAEHSLRESEKRYRVLFHSAPIAMIERDASALKAHIEALRDSGVSDFEDYLARNPEEATRCMALIKTIDYNPALLDLMEVPNAEALESGFGMADPREAARLAREIVLTIAGGEVNHERELAFRTHAGRRKNVLARALPISGHEDTLARMIIALVDITRRKQAEEALRSSEELFRDQAMRDDLTGLFNRRYLYRSLETWVEMCRSGDSKVSVIFMDLDHFKGVVDAHGHLNGSQAIREVAETIRDVVESPAFAVAYAGDEFVVVLPGFTDKQAMNKALEIQESMNRTTYLSDLGLEVSLQASFGVATFPDHALDMTSLLAAADRSLFTVKQSGKNAVGCCIKKN